VQTLEALRTQCSGRYESASGLCAIHKATLNGHRDAVSALLQFEGLLGT